MCSLMFSSKIPENITYINEFMQKRGPDITSSLVYQNHFYLHNLLSMTGEFTPQPIFSKDKKIVCLFNGEIYNYKDFGDYSCDTNCLIPMYEKYGKHFTDHLSGEYAIVIVDYNEKTVLLTTGTFGCKPLFISTTDGLGIATYKTGLERTGFKNITKVPANTTLIYSLQNWELKEKKVVTTFDLNQYKNTFEDWHKAFSEAVRIRAANMKEHIYLGLSSGFDSGAIVCELIKQKINFKCYSVIGSENKNILEKRYAAIQGKCDLEVITISPENKRIAHDWLLKNTEDWKYTIETSRSDYNERHLSLWDDNGSNNLSYIASLAKRDNKKIFLSGGGADEMFDYGWNGQSKYAHSNFGGLFPDDLSIIFPWKSVFGSSMESYIMKDEVVTGSLGQETRTPFINKEIWQEFLWLSPKLKNMSYKSCIANYLETNSFPYQPNEKIGF